MKIRLDLSSKGKDGINEKLALQSLRTKTSSENTKKAKKKPEVEDKGIHFLQMDLC